MSVYKGDYPTGATVRHLFDTFGSSGESLTMTGLAVGDIKIYKNGGTTERSSTSGITLLDTDGIDFDSRTGIHGFAIDTSDNADAGFYAAGNEYQVVVDAITVNSQTVRFVACSFSIERSGGALEILKSATYGLSALKTLIDTVDTVVDAVKAKTDNLPSDPADASVVAGLIAAAEAKIDIIDTNVDAVQAKTDNLPSDPADASVVAGLIAAAEAKIDTVDTNVDAIKAVTDKVDDTLEDQGGGVYGFTIAALQEGPGGAFELLAGTAQAGASDSITLETGAPTGNNRYRYGIVVITGGTGFGQSRQATAYDGTSKILSVTPDFDIVPDATSEYVVTSGGYDVTTVEALVTAIWAALRAENQVVGSMGEGVNARVTAIDEDTNSPGLLNDVLNGDTLLDINVAKVNDITVDGSGTDEDPWQAAE